jgi:archaellum component FlaF (FlaF/FlaG flagellin family)
MRRRYNTNNGAVDYSPFAVLNNGSTGALACGLFGGQSAKSIYTATGTAYLNNTGGIILPAIGDSIIATNIDAPLFALTGFTGSIEYQGTTPTSGINYEFSMRAWGTSTWGSWQSLSIANLNSELALIPNYNPDEVGLDFRLRMTATTASTTRIINQIVLPANISTSYNPAVWKIDASLFAPIGANYQVSNDVKTLASGTIDASPQVLELPSDFDGTIYDISAKVRKPGLRPVTVSSSYDYNPIDIRTSLEIDNAYTAENVNGIAFNKTTKTITVSETVSVSNIYDNISQWLSDLENFDVASFATSSGGTLLLTNQWNISITSTGSIIPGSNANKIITNGLLSIQSGGTYLIEIIDSNRTYYPPVNFSGFPSVANSNGKLPESVLGIKNQTTGIWTTYDVSSGSININLSELGSTGQLLTLVADAKGYYRTPEVKDVPLSSNGLDFSNLFEKITDSEGNEIYGLGIQSESDKITYNATDATFELGEGVISFYSALDRKEILTSSQSALTTMNTDIIRSMRFVKNAYANTVLLPSPLRITANSSATSSPILTDFTIVRLGDPTIDPYIHSARPEVQVRMSKLLVDPKSLTNLALIPALL